MNMRYLGCLKMKRSMIAVVGVVAVLLAAGAAFAGSNATNYFQGWENPAWVPGMPDWTSVTRVASGTHSITSATGVGHAEAVGGAGSKNGGYSAEWGGGWKESLDIYMDTGKTSDAKYSWVLTTAINKNVSGTATHLQDNIFMCAADPTVGKFVLGATNNCDWVPDSGFVRNSANGSELNLTQSGWLTFEWDYFQDGTQEKSKYNVYDASDSLLWTRNGPSHDLNDCDGLGNPIGGNRYAWFIYIKETVGGGQGNSWLAIDNSSTQYVPEPVTMAGLMLGIGSVLTYVRKRRTA